MKKLLSLFLFPLLFLFFLSVGKVFAAPILEYPIDGIAINDNTPLMQWADYEVEESTIKGYFYRVYHRCTDTLNIPSSCLVWPNATGLFRTSSEYQAGTTADGTYYWQVKSVDSQDNEGDWSSLEKVIIDTQKPVVPQIVFPTPEQYFNSTPILNDWTDVLDLSGIKEYRIEYVYDDDHTFSGAPYRIATLSNRNHVPGLWEQGGVTIRVQAFDNAGNEGVWSQPVHYFYDSTAPFVELTNPIEITVSGVVDIRGTVTDSNPHHYWLAIYNSENKQVAGPGTVNRADSFTDELLMKWDTTKFPYGEYTIKLEARDAANNKDSGSIVWKTLTVDNDTDRDGVKDSKDLCNEGSLEDFPWDSGKWGTNRWQVQNTGSILGWYQNKPFKGLLTPTYTKKTMEYTCGCNGHQILDELSPFGNTMLGHWKFGLSSSLVEEFSKDCSDGTIDGMYLLDEVVVASNGTTVDSITTTEGVEYLLKASGTYTFALGWGQDLNGENYGIADAKFNNRSASYNNGEAGWVNGAEWDDPYTNYLQVRTVTHGIDWIEDFNLDHIYTASFVGDGNKIQFTILDDAYGDNSGTIKVEIYGIL